MKYKMCLRNVLRLLFVVLPVELTAQNMRINGCQVIMNGPVQLVLHNAGLINNGYFTRVDGAIRFTGSQTVIIAGGNAFTLGNVVIGKSPGNMVELQQDIFVTGNLSMKGGNLLLNNRTLNLGSLGSIVGEGSQSYITGTNGGRVLVSRNVQTIPIALNPGNIGVELTSTTKPGLLVIERKHESEVLTNGNISVHRSFTITGNSQFPFNATLRFYYLDEELNNNNEADLTIWTNSDVGNFLTPIGKDGSDVAANWVEKNQLTRWGYFTLAAPGGSTELLRRGKNFERSIAAARLMMTSIQVYPNPATDQFKLVFSSGEKKDAVLSLYDQSGKLLQQKKIRCQEGINNVLWSLRNYVAGIYLVTDDTGTINVRVVKQ
jgi:Secretion system C-terminal sorting domain